MMTDEYDKMPYKSKVIGHLMKNYELQGSNFRGFNHPSSFNKPPPSLKSYGHPGGVNKTPQSKI